MDIKPTPASLARLSGLVPGPRGGVEPGEDKPEFAVILDSFREEIVKTPAEKARDEVLERHSLNEEAYRRLPARQREAIDREIVEAVERATKVSGDGAATEAIA